MADVMRSRIRLAGVFLVCAHVLLIPTVFDWGADWSFTVPKALLGQVLAAAELSVILALFIRSGRKAVVWSGLHVPVLLYVIGCAIATVFAMDPYLALFGSHERMLGFATIVGWVILYFSVVLFVRTKDDAYAVGLCMVAAALVVLGYELVQVTGRDPYRWTIEAGDRAFSTTGQPNALGQFAATFAAGAFAVAVVMRGLARWLRWAMVALSGALVWGAAATDSRAPVVGLVAAALVLVVASWWTRRSTQDARVAVLAGLAAIVALAALVVLTPIGARIAFTIQAQGTGDLLSRVDDSTAGRLGLYGIAIGEFLERPIVGYGPDNFVVGTARYRQEAAPRPVRYSSATSVHSWFFQSAATTGIIGTLPLLVVLGLAVLLAVRSGFAPLPLVACVALAANLGTGLATIDDLSTGWITWFCVAVIAASTARTEHAAAPGRVPQGRKRGRRAASSPSPGWRTPAAAAVVATAVLASLSASSAYGASKSAKLSADARLNGQAATSIQSAQAAVTSDPGRAEYWHTLGLAYVGANRLTEANAALERANNMTPYLAGYTGDLIQVQLAFAQAVNAAAKARALDLTNELVARDGNNPISYYYRAQAMGVAGDTSGAIAAIERAFVLDPGSTNPDLYRIAAQHYIIAKRPQDAVDIARKGIAAIGPVQAPKELRDVLDRALAALGLPPDPRPDPEACTSTRWVATPSSATAGTQVNFAVQAQGCPRQESQLAVLAPTATSPSYLNGGNWTSVFIWNTKDDPPGTYRIFLYTRRLGWAGPYQAKYEADYVLR
jgi:O-antigen ligase/tetratricopeptide (TPR) repeat protein